MELKKHKKNKTYSDILFRNFSVFTESEKGIKDLKTLVFQIALNGKLDFQKLSEGRIKKPLQDLVKNQKQYLKKEGIAFEEQSDSVWPIVALGDVFKEIKNGQNVNQIKNDGLYRVSRIQTIANGVIDLFATRWTNDKVNPDSFLKKGDILLSHINSFEHLAKTAIFNLDDKLIHGINLLKLKSNETKINSYFALHVFKLSDFIYKARKYAKKAVNQASINITNLKKIKIPLPPLVVQKEIVVFMGCIKDIEEQIKKEKNLSIQLSKSLKNNFYSPNRYSRESGNPQGVIKY